MTDLKPPRDWFPTLAGLGVAGALAIGLGWAFWGPAARIARVGFDEVWVTILAPPAKLKTAQ